MSLVGTTLPPALDGRSAPAGDPSAVRRVAARVETVADDVARGARALDEIADRLERQWQDDAGAAGVTALRLLARDAAEVAQAHGRAEDALLVCAVALEEALATWRRAQDLERLDAVERADRPAAEARGVFVSPYEADASPLRSRARWLADDAAGSAAAATRRASQVLDALADQLTPEQDRSGQALTAADHARGFVTGFVESVSSSVDVLASLSVPALVLDHQAWLARVLQLGDGIERAARHPGEALGAVVGLEDLQAGRYGEWLGGLAPDLVGGVLSMGGLPVVRRSAHVADELSELSEDVADLQRVTGRTDAGGPVELPDGADVPESYVTFVHDLSPERRRHVLDGDPPEVNGGRGGGHRSGTGKPGKTEFPPDWSDDEIIRWVMETARHPETAVLQPNGRWRVTAQHDGVTVEVVLLQDGTVWTAYPLPGGRGVVTVPRLRGGGTP